MIEINVYIENLVWEEDATNELVLGPLSYVKSTPTIWYLGFNGDEVRLYSKELVKQDLAEKRQLNKQKDSSKNKKLGRPS